jgi:hypothetical protein
MSTILEKVSERQIKKMNRLAKRLNNCKFDLTITYISGEQTLHCKHEESGTKDTQEYFGYNDILKFLEREVNKGA